MESASLKASTEISTSSSELPDVPITCLWLSTYVPPCHHLRPHSRPYSLGLRRRSLITGKTSHRYRPRLRCKQAFQLSILLTFPCLSPSRISLMRTFIMFGVLCFDAAVQAFVAYPKSLEEIEAMFSQGEPKPWKTKLGGLHLMRTSRRLRRYKGRAWGLRILNIKWNIRRIWLSMRWFLLGCMSHNGCFLTKVFN